MEQYLIHKMSCVNCGRVTLVEQVELKGTIFFEVTDWRCKECKNSFDNKIYMDKNGWVHQVSHGSAKLEDYQKYNNQKIKIN